MILKDARLHFVGIGGAGMSAIAEVLLRRGWRISGCDLRELPVFDRLRHLGAQIWVGHSRGHLRSADVLVVSRAIADDTDEILVARREGLTMLHRAQVLGEIMKTGRGIAVVGTHGKTTTTAMLACILMEAGMDPTVLVGAEVPELSGNARSGAGPWVVAEVDESDGSLVHVVPWAAVLTSLDVTDHRDFYGSAEHLERTFDTFLRTVPDEGFIIACLDHPGVRSLGAGLGRPVLGYGFGDDAWVRGEMRSANGRSTRAALWIDGRAAGEMVLRVPGRHNVSNALGAIAAAVRAGVPAQTAIRALATFHGARRRFEVRGEAGGVLVVDDYAHNPVKVSATLAAVREGWPDRRIIALFQPHRYSRTQTTHAEFAHAFDAAGDVVVTDIYAADEAPVPGVSAQLIVDAIAASRPVYYRPTTEAALDLVAQLAQPGTIVLTLGVGDIGGAGDALLRRLASQTAAGAGSRERITEGGGA